LKVFWIGPYLPADEGSGADLRSYHLMKGLADAGVRLEGAFLDHHGRGAEPFFETVHYYSSGSIMKGLRAIGSGVLGAPFNYGKYYHPDLLEHRDPDQLLYVDHLHLTINCEDQPEGLTWLDEHNLEFRLWDQYASCLDPLRSALVNWESQRVFRYEMDVLDSVDGFSIPSRLERDILPDPLSGKGRVVCNGVAPEWLEGGRRRVRESVDTLDTIGFIGKYDWPPNRRGVQQFLETVWTQREGSDFPSTLRLAGSSPPSSWEDIEGVHCPGYVDKSKDFFDAIDALVVPLDVGAGTRIKVLEAFSRGVPVLATEKAVEGIDVGWLPVAESIPDLRRLIDQSLQSTDQVQSTREQAFEFVASHHRWPELAGNLHEALLEVDGDS
jgi:glycosyltransferase involved in cell wall biosynthesis